MHEITRHIEESVIIGEDTFLRGMISGNVTVNENITLICNGSINGNIKVLPKANFILRGSLNGYLENQGRSEIYGIVNGGISNSSGDLKLDPKAVMNNL